MQATLKFIAERNVIDKTDLAVNCGFIVWKSIFSIFAVYENSVQIY